MFDFLRKLFCGSSQEVKSEQSFQGIKRKEGIDSSLQKKQNDSTQKTTKIDTNDFQIKKDVKQRETLETQLSNDPVSTQQVPHDKLNDGKLNETEINEVIQEDPKKALKEALKAKVKKAKEQEALQLASLASQKEHVKTHLDIVNVTIENYAKEVLEASLHKVILIDFGADWCAPCKQMMPILEKVIEDYSPFLRLCKINIDKNKDIAAEFNIQSIPTVIIFVMGKNIGQISGFVHEAQWIEAINQLKSHFPSFFITQNTSVTQDSSKKEWNSLSPEAPHALSSVPDSLETIQNKNEQSPEEKNNNQEEQKKSQERTLKAYEHFNKERYEDANISFQEILLSHQTHQIPIHPRVLAGLAHTLIFLHQREQAQVLFDQIPKEFHEDECVLALKNHLAFLHDLTSIKTIVDETDPLSIKFEKAMQEFIKGNIREALEELLLSVKQNKDWNHRLCQKTLLTLFSCLGYDHEIVLKAQRRLSTLLFS
jgi:thioredoxin